MPFPVSPNPGDSYTDAYGTVWIYAGSVNGWYRQEVVPGNETTYTGGGSGSATATGAAGEIQFTDGTNLDASPNLVWDDANDELEVTGDLKLLDGGTYTTTLQTITPTANRTVSIPDATGTLALVAGSSGQPIYNNAGAYAGLSTATIGTTGNITLSLNGAASTPPVSFTGTWFTGGTGTTTKPQLLIEPSGTTSTAWSTSGTGLGVNAASGFTGNLLDLQVNGTRVAIVRNDGLIGASLTTGSPAFECFTSGSNALARSGDRQVILQGVINRGVSIASNGLVSWTSTSTASLTGAGDVALARDATAVIKVTDGGTGNGTLLAQLRAQGTAPASATATGTAGDIRYDADYIYVCTATNTWKRAALATW